MRSVRLSDRNQGNQPVSQPPADILGLLIVISRMEVGMESLEELLEGFKKNVRKGVQATLMFNGQDSVTLSSDPNSDGHVGFGIVRKEMSPDRREEPDGQDGESDDPW